MSDRRPYRTDVVCVLVAATVWLTAFPTWAADSESRARELFAQGKKHYAERDFEAAIAAFEAAGKLHPSPLLDYNTGRCFDELGRIEEAIARYEAYLRGRPDAPNAAEVRRRVDALKQQLKERKEDPYADLEARRTQPASGGGENRATSHAGASPSTSPVVPPASPVVPPASPVVPPASPVVPPASPVVPAAGLAMSGQPTGGQGSSARAPKAVTNQPSPTTPWTPRAADEGPVYTKWWFWVAVVGGAAIAGFIIAMAVSGGDDGGEPTSASQQGAVLLEF